MNTTRKAAGKASLDPLVRPSDIGVFSCHCCGRDVGVRRVLGTGQVRRHKNSAGVNNCIMSGAMNVRMKPNDQVEFQEGSEAE